MPDGFMPMLAAWLHDIDPYAIQLWAGGPIRWYGLSYLAGFVFAFFFIRRITQVGRTTLKPREVMDLVVTVAIGVVVGGRLGYVVFYKPEMLFAFDSSLPFWDVLRINKGGMASHGGFLGVVAACFIYARRHNHSFLHLLDISVFTAPIGLMLGRIANFINGELLGRPCSADFPLAVKFPQEMGLEQWQADEGHRLALSQLGHELVRLDEIAEADRLNLNAIVDRAIIIIQEGAGVARQTVVQIVEPLLTPRHPSQLYQAVAEGAVLFAVLLMIWAKPRKPGVVFGWTISIYSVLRIVTELWREPDSHLADQGEFAAMGITRGQLLSIILGLVGIAVTIWFARRKVEPMGGWRRLRIESDADSTHANRT